MDLSTSPEGFFFISGCDCWLFLVESQPKSQHNQNKGKQATLTWQRRLSPIKGAFEQHEDIIRKHIKPWRSHQKIWKAHQKTYRNIFKKESEPCKKGWWQHFLGRRSLSFLNMFRYVFWWAFHVFWWLLHGFICFLMISSCCSKAPLMGERRLCHVYVWLVCLCLDWVGFLLGF